MSVIKRYLRGPIGSAFIATGLIVMLSGAAYASGRSGHLSMGRVAPNRRATDRRQLGTRSRVTSTLPTYARAYGYVVGREIPKALDTVRCAHSKKGLANCKRGSERPSDYNVVVRSPVPGSEKGIYCLQAGHGVSPAANTVVIVSAAGSISSTPASQNGSTYFGLKGMPYAAWIPGGLSCASSQFEIQTDELTSSASGILAGPSEFVSFSFVIP